MDSSEPTTTDLVRRRVRARRLALEMTTAQLSEALTAQDCPLNRSAVVNLEAGIRRVIGVDLLCALAIVLKCSPADLLIPLDSEEAFRPTPAHPGMTAEQGRAWFGGRPRSRMVLIDSDALGEG